MTRWGILGTGYAAEQFAIGLGSLPEAEILAVASQSEQRASAFAKRFSIANNEASYNDLIAREDIDVIYVAAIADFHHELCLKCIHHEKPVLCEKPFAMNAEEAIEIGEAAKLNGVFCMEAMWSRFIPLMQHVYQRVGDGEIGDVLSVTADFGLRETPTSNPRLFRPESGGAILDLGVYPVSFAVQYLGMPEKVSWQCVDNEYENGAINERASGALSFKSGAVASVLADICCQTPTQATIIGTEGYVQIETPMYRPTSARLFHTSAPRHAGNSDASFFGKAKRIAAAVKRRIARDYELIRVGYQGNGYQYQAAEVMRCLNEGQTESGVMPLSQSVDVLKIIDAAKTATQSSPPEPCHA